MLAHKAVLRAAQRATAPSPNNCSCAKRVSLKAKTGREELARRGGHLRRTLRLRDAGEHKAKWGGRGKSLHIKQPCWKHGM